MIFSLILQTGLVFVEFYINSTIILRFIHDVAHISHSLLLIVKVYSIVWLYQNLFIHLPISRY